MTVQEAGRDDLSEELMRSFMKNGFADKSTNKTRVKWVTPSQTFVADGDKADGLIAAALASFYLFRK